MLSTLCDIPTRSIRLERDKTSFPMPLGKKTKLSKSANEQALADQLNVASYAFLQKESELASLLDMPYSADIILQRQVQLMKQIKDTHWQYS